MNKCKRFLYKVAGVRKRLIAMNQSYRDSRRMKSSVQMVENYLEVHGKAPEQSMRKWMAKHADEIRMLIPNNAAGRGLENQLNEILTS